MTGSRITALPTDPALPTVACHEAAEEQTRERFEKLKPARPPPRRHARSGGADDRPSPVPDMLPRSRPPPAVQRRPVPAAPRAGPVRRLPRVGGRPGGVGVGHGCRLRLALGPGHPIRRYLRDHPPRLPAETDRLTTCPACHGTGRDPTRPVVHPRHDRTPGHLPPRRHPGPRRVDRRPVLRPRPQSVRRRSAHHPGAPR